MEWERYICILVAVRASQPEKKVNRRDQRYRRLNAAILLRTGEASASGHITPSFGGNTVAVIGGAIGAGVGGAAAVGGVPAIAGLGGKNGGRAGSPAIGGGKEGIPAA